ncbi:MAG: chloride channel protein [Verrucomicrobiota bacterium]|jgi:CIC family chloride channel protein|nr:chloride channel protein [Verrucomicrobiota bacterium]MDP7177615.1 chloride channel protein [Verrucomicrobiota bacterium]
MTGWLKNYSPQRFLISFGLAAIIGLVASFASVAFVEGVFWINGKLFISPKSRDNGEFSHLIPWFTVLAPTIGGFIVGGLLLLIRGNQPQGIADIIFWSQTGKGGTSDRKGLITVITYFTSLSFGASVGMYGPLVSLGSLVGNFLSKLTADHRRLGIIAIGCGVSSAISTAFNAPIAGVIFAHEVILRHYSIRAFAPVTISAYVSQVMATEVFKRPRLLEVGEVSIQHPYEYGAFLLVGVVGAAVAIFYMRGVLVSGKLAGKLKLPIWIKPPLAGLILGLICLGVPELLGVGLDTTKATLNIEQVRAGNLDYITGMTTMESVIDANTKEFVLKAILLLVVLCIGKSLMTGFCLGMGFCGGVFSPALFIGATFGALFGFALEAMMPGSLNLSFYTICGMGAVTSAVIGAPISTILVVFELTENYDLAKAVLISVVFSNIICSRLFGRSLFDVQLLARGFDFSLGKDKVVLQQKTIRNYVTHDFVQVTPETPCNRALEHLLAADQTEGYIVSEKDTYLGQVTLNELLHIQRNPAKDNPAVGELAQHEQITLTDMTSIFAAMKKVEDFVGESVPVVSAKDHLKLVGVIPEGNIFKAYSDAIEEIRQDEYGDS